MKIVYCIHSVYNPGGMERVLLNKLRWLRSHTAWEFTVVTTDQHGRPPFFTFPDGVEFIDLGINYSDDNSLGAVAKTLGYLRRRKAHKKALTELLMRIRPDITVSLFPCESGFIPGIKDGSKKVLELHQCRLFRLQYNRTGLRGLSDRLRYRSDLRLVRRFDRFVSLSEEDRTLWGREPNIEVIPNAAILEDPVLSDCSAKRVIAAGRLDYQKSFDRLLEAWALVRKDSACSGWKLDIFGQGPWEEMLKKQIAGLGLEGAAAVNPPTSHIGAEYAASSIMAMSSHYEGFPMVMIEAMACGLPAVSFGFHCGPADIIRNGVNGIVVPDGDVPALAEALKKLIKDDSLRRSMGAEAAKITQTYGQEAVMAKWMKLFEELCRES